MATIPDQRHQSGQVCRVRGQYEFDGYVDGTSDELPDPDEAEVWLVVGQAFPFVSRVNKACYWKLTEGIAGPPQSALSDVMIDDE